MANSKLYLLWVFSRLYRTRFHLNVHVCVLTKPIHSFGKFNFMFQFHNECPQIVVAQLAVAYCRLPAGTVVTAGAGRPPAGRPLQHNRHNVIVPAAARLPAKQLLVGERFSRFRLFVAAADLDLGHRLAADRVALDRRLGLALDDRDGRFDGWWQAAAGWLVVARHLRVMVVAGRAVGRRRICRGRIVHGRCVVVGRPEQAGRGQRFAQLVRDGRKFLLLAILVEDQVLLIKVQNDVLDLLVAVATLRRPVHVADLLADVVGNLCGRAATALVRRRGRR